MESLDITGRVPRSSARAIYALAVSARFRGQGIGEALLATAIAWFRERGITRVELRVSSSNEVASVFWRKQGFAPFSETLSRAL